jgi:uncharacterized radical SAM superfamily protein
MSAIEPVIATCEFCNRHILLAAVMGKLHIEADSFDILVAGMVAGMVVVVVVAAVGMEAVGAVVAYIEVVDTAAAAMRQA